MAAFFAIGTETWRVRTTAGGARNVLQATATSHESVELSAANRRAIYVPPGFAHGFQTLDADTEVQYQMTDDFQADLASGYRWNDPAFGIAWPRAPSVMSDRDRAYPDLVPADCAVFRET